jgi:heparanase 1
MRLDAMQQRLIRKIFVALMVAGVAVPMSAQVAALNPGTMKKIATVDERYQSYNIEMLEVTGGDFWKPYSSIGASKPDSGNHPVGMDPNMYEYRAPLDLSSARLRKLAAALGPAYVRVSGTWANSTYFQDSDAPAPKTPPAGFKGTLTRSEWKGVIDFSKAANAKIVTSFATSGGTRDAAGVWTPKEADKFLAYTKAAGGEIAAAEYMNEPTFATMGGAPAGYDAGAYAKDMAVFKPWLRQHAVGTLLLGPGGVGEGGALALPITNILPSEKLMEATGPVYDAFSYHFYGGVSERCSKSMPSGGTRVEDALTSAWLQKTDGIEAYYAQMRDKFEPGKALWVTETGETACGGDPWAKTYLDSFRYLNQLGTLAQKGVKVVMHNTLDASDYALLDEHTYEPRPNYWAALLWRKMMGTTVLDPGVSPAANVYVYAQCLRGVKGGVAVLAINADKSSPAAMSLPKAAERYTLSATEQSAHVELNGVELRLGEGDALPALRGAKVAAGEVTLAPETITFFGVSGAENAACRE